MSCFVARKSHSFGARKRPEAPVAGVDLRPPGKRFHVRMAPADASPGRRPGFGLRICMLFSAIALALSLCCVNRSEASASTAFRVVTWNTAMGNQRYRQYNPVILTAVAYVRANPSWQVNLQEVCRTQAAQIVWNLNLTGGGFAWFFGPASSGAMACGNTGNGPYGNAVLNIGVPLPGYGGARYHILSPHAPRPENKNLICGGMQNIGFRYEGCSLHVTAFASNFSIVQTGDAWNAIGAYANADGALSVAGGDFNLPYTGSIGTMPSTWQNWFFTHDESWAPYQRPTHNSGTMIDYMFADRRYIQQFGRYTCGWYAVSDHGLCPGVFLLR